MCWWIPKGCLFDLLQQWKTCTMMQVIEKGWGWRIICWESWITIIRRLHSDWVEFLQANIISVLPPGPGVVCCDHLPEEVVEDVCLAVELVVQLVTPGSEKMVEVRHWVRRISRGRRKEDSYLTGRRDQPGPRPTGHRYTRSQDPPPSQRGLDVKLK